MSQHLVFLISRWVLDLFFNKLFCNTSTQTPMKQFSLIINYYKVNILVIASPRIGARSALLPGQPPCLPQSSTLTPREASTTTPSVLLLHQPLCVSEHYAYFAFCNLYVPALFSPCNVFAYTLLMLKLNQAVEI